MSKKRILLVEDEPGLVLTLTDRLSKEGYTVESVSDGPAGLKRGATGSFDLIILDVMLPYSNGLDVCRDLRQQAIKTPILMLTAKGQLVDKVVGLKLGADDYLTKPFEMMELLARIEALLRRASGSTLRQANESSYEFGPIRVDLRRTQVFRDGDLIELSAREFKLLRYFIEHRGATLTRVNATSCSGIGIWLQSTSNTKVNGGTIKNCAGGCSSISQDLGGNSITVSCQ